MMMADDHLSICALNEKALFYACRGLYDEAVALLQKAFLRTELLYVHPTHRPNKMDSADGGDSDDDEDEVLEGEVEEEDMDLNFGLRAVPIPLPESVLAQEVLCPFALYHKALVFIVPRRHFTPTCCASSAHSCYYSGIVQDSDLLLSDTDHHFAASVLIYNKGLYLQLKALYEVNEELLDTAVETYNVGCGILTDYCRSEHPVSTWLDLAFYNNKEHTYQFHTCYHGAAGVREDCLARMGVILEDYKGKGKLVPQEFASFCWNLTAHHRGWSGSPRLPPSA